MPGGPATDPDGPRDVAGVAWRPAKPGLRPLRLVVAWVVSAASVYVAGAIVPGVSLDDPGGAFLVAALIAVVNAVLPPLIAALRLPFTLVAGFLLVLFADAGALMLDRRAVPRGAQDRLVRRRPAGVAGDGGGLDRAPGDHRDQRRRRVHAARDPADRTPPGGRTTNRRGRHHLSRDRRPGAADPAQRDARRQRPEHGALDRRGRLPRLPSGRPTSPRRPAPARPGSCSAPTRTSRRSAGSRRRAATMMTCSAPADCAEIERRRATGVGLLVDGGASRGNLLSGEADEVILTVSRMEAEKRANPGYRAFLANGFNVTRALVLFVWEVMLEWTAAIRAIRRDVRPRGHRGGIYPFLRGAMCVIVRDLIVFGVLTDMMRGRPAVYATFSSYDEVAHHSGLERADTMEALRKLDQQFGRIERARRYAPRPYEIVVLSDHGQTQGATFKQRNGYGLDELVERSLSRRRGRGVRRRRRAERDGRPRDQRGDRAQASEKRPKNDVSGSRGRRARLRQPRADLPDGGAAAADDGGDRRAPPGAAPGAARAPPRRLAAGPLVRARRRRRSAPTAPTTSTDGRVEGEDPLAPFSPTAAQHLLRTDGFEHVADIMVGSFYDPELDEGCAFEELISLPRRARRPADPAVHPPPGRARGRPTSRSSAPRRCIELLTGWRHAARGARLTRIGRRTGPSPRLRSLDDPRPASPTRALRRARKATPTSTSRSTQAS